MDKNLVEVGSYKEEFNIKLDINLPIEKIYQSKGLYKHLLKRKHFKCLKYIDNISDILIDPNYIGINPNEKNSIEIIKKFDDNILVGIILNIEGNYFYVSTIYDIQESKILRRLHSGRIVKFE